MAKTENSRFSIHTLGCKLNYAESSAIAEKLQTLGLQVVDFNEIADIYIIHSCTVTQTAEKKTRQALAKARNQNPDARMMLIGCMADSVSSELKEKYQFEFLLGNDRKMLLPELLSGALDESAIQSSCEKMFFPAAVSGERTRSFLKIQDGCDYFCSYCTIPYVRGRSRSGKISDVLLQIEKLVNDGVKEVVFTGVNAADFGKHQGETFHDLLEAIEARKFQVRFRLSSVEPDLLEDKTIEMISKSKTFMPHFHLPLQSGSNAVLAEMNRKYDTSLFAYKVNYIRQLMPEACIAADIIIGFPSEGDEEFEEAYRFIQSIPISYLHIFPYSDRPKARASKMEKKNLPEVIKSRVKKMSLLSDEKKADFYVSGVAKTALMLAESERKGGMMFGFTENYIKVAIPYDATKINQLVRVRLLESGNNDFLKGEVI